MLVKRILMNLKEIDKFEFSHKLQCVILKIYEKDWRVL